MPALKPLGRRNQPPQAHRDKGPPRVWALSAESIEKGRKSATKGKMGELERCMLDEWASAKRKRDFGTADAIRQELWHLGVDTRYYRPRDNARRVEPKTPRQESASNALSSDLGKHLDRWVAAKRCGDALLADSVEATLRAIGVDPNTVWPDMAWPSDNTSESHTNGGVADPILMAGAGLPNGDADGIAHVQEADQNVATNAGAASDADAAAGAPSALLDEVGLDPNMTWPSDAAGESLAALQGTETVGTTSGDGADLTCNDSRQSAPHQDVKIDKRAVETAVADAATMVHKNVERASAESGGPFPKHSGIETWKFALDITEKAPTSVLACDSFLLFLDKRLARAPPPAPAVGGPQSLHARLEAYADCAGRLASLRSPSGWDARARRVLDVAPSAAAATDSLREAEAHVAAEAAALDGELLSCGQWGAEVLTRERRAWAWDRARWEWLVWCSRLLSARKAALLARDVGGGARGDAAGVGMDAELSKVDIIKLLLNQNGTSSAAESSR